VRQELSEEKMRTVSTMGSQDLKKVAGIGSSGLSSFPGNFAANNRVKKLVNRALRTVEIILD
jgi:hypothetical protein